MISDYLRSVARCPGCQRGPLDRDGPGLACPSCGRSYPALSQLERSGASDGTYLDLRPPAGTFGDLTDYAEEEFHHRAGALRPPFLSARIKLEMMRKMLSPSKDDRVLDIGCGNGRFVYYARHDCGELVGIDAGAHFAPESLASVDLARGDIRRLPFADGSFDKAFSLDVLEHLTEEGVEQMLSEARRVLKDGGRFFLYSHVMMSSRLAVFQRGVNRLVQWLDRRGWLDNAPERERKSDHQNALQSYTQLQAVLERAGFGIERIRYYNVFFKAILEDLMLPLVEHNFYRKKASANGDRPPVQTEDHHHDRERPDVGRWTHAPLSLASYLMKLDVMLFGRVRTGPFFLLLRAL